MSKPIRFASAVSLAALASMTVGCAAPQGQVTAASSFGGKADGEVGLATRALASLNSNDIPAAISFAERAVEKTPNDAGFRGLLGNIYFAGGRFWSAESAYKDSLAIYSNQPQVILKLALVEIALGKKGEATAFLEAGRPVLDPADYGLALALAGRTAEAVAVLQASARAQGADSRVRQNLALAYAFSGDWDNARTVAAQDVPAGQLDARIQQWMQFARPGKASDQVAALVGVTPAATDQGQPVRLALAKPDTRLARVAPAAPAPIKVARAPQRKVVPQAPAPVAQREVAKAAPAPAPQYVAAVAPPAPAPQFVAAAPAPAPVDPVRVAAKVPAQAPVAKPVVVAARAESPAPLTMALIAAAAPEAPSAFAAFMPKQAAPIARPARVRPTPAAAPRLAARRGNSNTVVQLGAYRSPQAVSAAWAYLSQHYPALRAYLPLRARFVSPKGTFWRLSIQGFDTQREALARCQLLKRGGGNCFVRNFAGDAPVQYASR